MGKYIGLNVPTAVLMKGTVFLDVKKCTLVEVH